MTTKPPPVVLFFKNHSGFVTLALGVTKFLMAVQYSAILAEDRQHRATKRKPAIVFQSRHHAFPLEKLVRTSICLSKLYNVTGPNMNKPMKNMVLGRLGNIWLGLRADFDRT